MTVRPLATPDVTEAGEVSRRQFLGQSARQAAGVAATVIALGQPARGETRGDQLRLGVIGVRNRGKALALELAGFGDVVVRSLCDVDQSLLTSAQTLLRQSTGSEPRVEPDFRRLLDDRDIDGVVIATPDHWHAAMAVAAMDAGKDVYLESPATGCIAEGSELLAAVGRTQRVLQCGVQERSGAAFQDAMRYLHTGRLGSVKLARAWVVHRRKPIPRKADGPAPEHFDYANWLGVTGQQPYNANRSHFNWRWFWDFGGGELTHWGSHLLDVARWGLQVNWPERVSATGGKYAFEDATETPDTLMVQYAFGQRSIQWEHRLWSGHAPEGRSSAVAFYGTQGVLVLDRGGWKVYDGESAGGTCTGSDLDRDHLRNFLECMRTRATPACPVSTAIVSAGVCHLGNIAYRVGREISFDPQTGLCRNDPEATQLVDCRRLGRSSIASRG